MKYVIIQMLWAVPEFQFVERHHSEELFAFLGLCIVSGVLRTRKEPAANLWTTNAAYARLILHAKLVRDRFIHILHVIHFYDKTTRNSNQ
jgi:hypothetical protein